MGGCSSATKWKIECAGMPTACQLIQSSSLDFLFAVYLYFCSALCNTAVQCLIQSSVSECLSCVLPCYCVQCSHLQCGSLVNLCAVWLTQFSLALCSVALRGYAVCSVECLVHCGAVQCVFVQCGIEGLLSECFSRVLPCFSRQCSHLQCDIQCAVWLTQLSVDLCSVALRGYAVCSVKCGVVQCGVEGLLSECAPRDGQRDHRIAFPPEPT